MLKKLTLGLSIISYSIGLLCGEDKPIVLAFDLHYVLFKPSFKKVLTAARHLPHKGYLLKLAFSPTFWRDVRSIAKETKVAEEIFNNLSAKYTRLIDAKPQCIQLFNALNPQDDVIELIKKLKRNHKNIKIYICSNIGELTFSELKKCYPEIFELFDGAYVSCPHEGYIQKPDIEFYRKFENYVKEQLKEYMHIVLIDDSRINIKCAKIYGFKAIHYNSCKQVSQELNAYLSK